MPLTKLQFRPGINREITSYSNEGGWFDCDKIRFQQGFPEQIGGWQRKSNNTFLGTCRTLHPWVALDRNSYLGVGTNLKYYIEFGGDYYDITPIRTTETLTDPFSVTDDSNVLTVTDNAHGAVTGDFVTFSGADSLGGNVTAGILNQEHQLEVIDSNTYRIVLPVTANVTDAAGSPGGGTVAAAYQVNVGLDTTVTGTGWGTDVWGAGAWGVASDAPVVTSTLRLWSHDNFGQDLIYNVRDGGVYYWTASGANPLTVRGLPLTDLPNANRVPTVAKQVLISDRDRHVITFGCDDEFDPGVQDPMLIRFSSQESVTDWETRPNNTAGSLRLSSGSEIVAAVETRQQVLVYTDTTLYAMQFLGPPFTFGVSTLSEGITIQSPGAASAVQDRVFWMGKNEFYVYTGAVERLPCTVRSFVFDRLDRTQAEKVVSGVNSTFGEVWWFYPTTDSGGLVDSYVVYNYEDGTWYFGSLERTAWLDRGVNAFPVAAGRDGYLYEHENGINDGSVSPSRAIESFLQSSPLDIGDGDQFAFISRMIPDVTFRNSTAAIPKVDLTISVRNFSDGTYFDSTTQGFVKTQAAPVDQRTEQLFFRLRGRQMSLRITGDERNVTWRLGSPRIDLRTDGRR